MAKADLTAGRLRELLDYDPDSGVFRWKITAGRKKAGEEAGWLATNHNGTRRTIEVDQRNYKAHRLAWFFMHGVWPVGVIDHINGNPQDNRISNLRDVSQKMNLQNERVGRSWSRSGLLGAHWLKRDSKWAAHIRVDGKTIRLGTFTTAEDAHIAYLSAKRKLHEGCTI